MGAGSLLMTSVQGALPETGAVAPGTVDVASPEANLAGFIRLMASMVDEDVPWWYNGTVYAVRGEEFNPQAVFVVGGEDFERVAPNPKHALAQLEVVALVMAFDKLS